MQNFAQWFNSIPQEDKTNVSIALALFSSVSLYYIIKIVIYSVRKIKQHFKP